MSKFKKFLLNEVYNDDLGTYSSPYGMSLYVSKMSDFEHEIDRKILRKFGDNADKKDYEKAKKIGEKLEKEMFDDAKKIYETFTALMQAKVILYTKRYEEEIIKLTK